MTDKEYFERRIKEMAGERAIRLRNYHELNQIATKGQTVCAGSSLMEFFPINELLMNTGSSKIVYNRGMQGYTIAEYDAVLDVCVLELQPSKLIINIGSNDLNLAGDTIENLIAGYRKLLLRVKQELPECKITLLAYYPCCKEKPGAPVPPGRIPRTMENVNLANSRVEKLAEELGCEFANLNEKLMDNGYLREDIALDPIHFSPKGYAEIFPELLPLL